MFEIAHLTLEIVTMARNGSGFFEDTKMSYYIRKNKQKKNADFSPEIQSQSSFSKRQ